MNKLFGTLKTRYAVRPSGYTRVLRTEPKDTYDQAPSAILELVDGPRDMRFAMTAATVARDRMLGKPHTDLTRRNMAKVTQYRGAQRHGRLRGHGQAHGQAAPRRRGPPDRRAGRRAVEPQPRVPHPQGQAEARLLGPRGRGGRQRQEDGQEGAGSQCAQGRDTASKGQAGTDGEKELYK